MGIEREIVPIKHPGEIPLRIEPKFAGFIPFVSREGLTRDEHERFVSLLERVFACTGRFWRPSFCKTSPQVTEAVAAVRSQAFFPEIVGVHTKGFTDNAYHLWTVIEWKDKPDLIIDHSGFPEPLAGNRVLPYFGVIAGCMFQESPRIAAQQMYAGGRDLAAITAAYWKSGDKK